MKFFGMKTIFGVYKSPFLGVNIFHFGCYCRIKNNFQGFYKLQNIKTTFHMITSRSITRNALQCNGKGSFCYGWRNIFLSSSQEKRTVTALARRGETPPTRTAPSGWRTPCWKGPFANPISPQQLVKPCIVLMYLFQIQIFCLWFSLAGSSHRSRSCSETS